MVIASRQQFSQDTWLWGLRPHNRNRSKLIQIELVTESSGFVPRAAGSDGPPRVHSITMRGAGLLAVPAATAVQISPAMPI